MNLWYLDLGKEKQSDCELARTVFKLQCIYGILGLFEFSGTGRLWGIGIGKGLWKAGELITLFLMLRVYGREFGTYLHMNFV